MKFISGISGSPQNQFKKGNTINVGKKYSQERRDNISNATRIAMENHRGEKSYNWNGGKLAQRERALNFLRNRRMMVLKTLGSVCAKCGFSDARALQIDHIDGGGYIERKDKTKTRTTYHKRVMESFLAGENKYQLLCANCNWIKRFENNEVRRKRA